MYALPILYTDRHILFQGKHLGMILDRLQYFKTEFTITCTVVPFFTLHLSMKSVITWLAGSRSNKKLLQNKVVVVFSTSCESGVPFFILIQ